MVKNNKSSIICQLAGRLNGLKKLKQADFKSKLTVATAVVQSKIQYVLPLYGGAPEYLIRAIQVQQLKAARFVCGYSIFYWSTLQRNFSEPVVGCQSGSRSFTPLHCLPHNIWSDMVHPHPVNTRAALQGQIRFSNTYKGFSELTRNSFKYRAQSYYSRIDVSIRRQPLKAFKMKIKHFTERNIPVR